MLPCSSSISRFKQIINHSNQKGIRDEHLQENSRDILKESSVEDAGPSLMLISEAVQQLVALGGLRCVVSKCQVSTKRTGNPQSKKHPNEEQHQATTALITSAEFSWEGRFRRPTAVCAIWFTKFARQPEEVQEQASGSNGEPGDVLSIQYCEAAHIYPFASIKKSGTIVTSVHALIKVFGRGTAQRFTDALRMVDLDSTVNLICLDHIPRRMFNDGRLALQPINRGTQSNGDHFIRLRVHLLQTQARQYELRAWRSDLAQDPYELLENFQLGDDEPQKPRLVSSVTQRGISDGHKFDITAKTQEDLPNWDLELRYRISVMNHLISAAGVSNEEAGESDEEVSDEEFEDIDVVEGAIRNLEEIAKQRLEEADEDDV
ncbi:uncharacterized protein BDZ83DRAFT_647555, partial [Colletotrichum acutatum]